MATADPVAQLAAEATAKLHSGQMTDTQAQGWLMDQVHALGTTVAPNTDPAPAGAAAAGASGTDSRLSTLGDAITKAAGEPLPSPPGAADMPKLPDHPIVDPHQWQNLGVMLVGMAMLSGGTKGNWLNAAAALSGAVNGYAQGNMERAKDEYTKFQIAYKEAAAKEESINQQYRNLLQSRNLSINEMISQYRALSMEHGREAQIAAAQQRNVEEMWYHQQSLEQGQQKIAAAKTSAEASLHPDAKSQQFGDVAALMYYMTGKQPSMPFGAKSPQRIAYANSIGELPQKLGMSNEEFAMTAGTNPGRVRAMTFLQNRVAQLTAAGNGATSNMDLALKYARQIPSSDWMPLTQALRAGKQWTGSGPAEQFYLALNAASVEYARVRSGMTGGGHTPVSQTEALDKLIGNGLSYDQLLAARQTMGSDISNVEQGANETIAQIQQALKESATPGAGAVGGPTMAPGSPAPSGAPQPPKTVNWNDLGGSGG